MSTNEELTKVAVVFVLADSTAEKNTIPAAAVGLFSLKQRS